VPPSHGNIVGQTALHIAALWGSVETMEVILNAGADPNIQNRMKMTPLHCAIRGTFQCFRETHPHRLRCVRLLLETGADVELRDASGRNAMESIDDAVQESRTRKMGNVEEEMEEMREELSKGLGGGASGASQLAICIETLDLEGLHKCLSGNTNIGLAASSQMEKNKGLLAAAEKFKSFVDEQHTIGRAYELLRDVIHALLEGDADPNTFPMIPNTPSPLEGAPLHIVTSSVCSSITTMAPPSSEIVSEVGSAIVRELRLHGAKLGSVTMALLPDAAKRGRVRAVEFLLRSAGVDPNYRGRQGMTSLILASRSGRTDVVKFLLENESSDIVGIADDAGKGAIDYARANGKEDIVRLLLEKGAR